MKLPKEQKDKQRSTKHTYKTKDQVTRTPLKTGCFISSRHICVGRCLLFCLFSWSHGSWIYSYLCNQCLSLHTLWVRILIMARCTTFIGFTTTYVIGAYHYKRCEIESRSGKVFSIHHYIRVITKLPNSGQSYKGKVKTHNYINRQNQSTTGKLWKP